MANDPKQVLDEAEEKLDAGEFEQALEAVEAVLKGEPKNVRASLLEVEALIGLDRLDEAAPVLDKLVLAQPQSLAVLVTAAEFAAEFEADDHERLEETLDLLDRAEKIAKKIKDNEGLGRIEWVRGQVCGALADLPAAEAAYDRAHTLLGEDHELLVDLGVARFEMLKIDEARTLLEAAVKREPEDPRPRHFLARVLERQGDVAAAKRQFEKATELDEEGYPPAVTIPKAKFEKHVESVLATLPDEVKKALGNVPVIVEDLPHSDDLVGDPRLSPMSLGLYKGHPVAGHGAHRGDMDLPSQVILYQKNLERAVADEEELEAEIEATLLHEVGHAVGWDEDDLYERGLD